MLFHKLHSLQSGTVSLSCMGNHQTDDCHMGCVINFRQNLHDTMLNLINFYIDSQFLLVYADS